MGFASYGLGGEGQHVCSSQLCSNLVAVPGAGVILLLEMKLQMSLYIEINWALFMFVEFFKFKLPSIGYSCLLESF